MLYARVDSTLDKIGQLACFLEMNQTLPQVLQLNMPEEHFLSATMK